MRVAVVGVGYLGEHHARVFSEIEGIELSGVVDIRRDRALDIASRFSTQAFTDYRDVLDKVDAISIATPTTSHHEIALNVLRA
ncbi:MAG: Gfo/Idh/MocA family protein, partial [Thermodesulfovibrionales bacterium]